MNGKGKGKIRRMFPGGNTAKGFHSFFDYITGEKYNKRYIIKGGPGVGKSTFMTGIANHMLGLGFDIDEYHCPTDPDSLDAIFISGLGVAIVDGTPPHAIEPRYPGIKDDIIWLGEYWDDQDLVKHKKKIIDLNKKADMLFKIAFEHLKGSGVSYEEWKLYGKSNLNKEKYNYIVRQIEEDLFTKSIKKESLKGVDTRLFASAISGNGIVNYTRNLIELDYKIYVFSGMPGSGIAEAIKKIAKRAEMLGLNTQKYYHPMDINEIDMLILPQLNSLLINKDQTLAKGNILFDPNQVDTSIDFNSCLNMGKVREYTDDIKNAEKRYYEGIERAIYFLYKAKKVHGEIEKYYVDAMDFYKVDLKREKILKEILTLSESKI